MMVGRSRVMMEGIFAFFEKSIFDREYLSDL
jgi:hypothetical protein